MNTVREQLMRAVVGSVVLLWCMSTTPTGVAAQEVPEIEPPLSRLYGSDELDFGGLFVSGAISPDGRWLVYSRARVEDATEEADPMLGADGMNLWIVPLDGSREPIRLTTGAYWDAGPFWFPSGDRILFRSTRADPGGRFQYLMTLDIDPSTGRAMSVPRQITLEPTLFNPSYQVSPDGRQVVYVARPAEEGRDDFMLKVLPAIGGQARTVWGQREAMDRPVWGDDGFLYFLSALAVGQDVAVSPGYAIRRVPAAGGEVETVSTWPDVSAGVLSADGRTFLWRTTPRRSETAVYEVASVHGRGMARFTLPQNMTLSGCFTRDAYECLATTENATAPLKVIPVNGGPTRQLSEGGGHNWPLGWTPDGREVVIGSEIDGTRIMMAAPLSGGVVRQLYRQPPEEWVYGPSVLEGRYVLYGAKDPSDGAVVLRILDVQSGLSREITRAPWVNYTRYNPSQSADRFLYAERRAGRFEFRAVHPEGEPVLLRAFPDTAFPPTIGVHGERIAYWVESDGRSTLYLARAGESQALAVLTFPGSVGQRGSSPPVWSPDGRHLATGYWRAETNELDALIVEIDESSHAAGAPRVLEELTESWWSLAWTPAGDAFVVVGGDVWMVSIDGQAPPMNLTREEPGPIWSYALSPDGRHIAVSPEVRRGGAIWLVDLSDIRGGTGR
jgi:Tol biopolymer transport system component